MTILLIMLLLDELAKKVGTAKTYNKTQRSASFKASKVGKKTTAPAKAKKRATSRGVENKFKEDEESKKLFTIEGLEKERNFYFSKLREIEILMQRDDDMSKLDSKVKDGIKEFRNKVISILYQTDDNEEFQQPQEGDET